MERGAGRRRLERREFLRTIDAVKKRTQRARKFSGQDRDWCQTGTNRGETRQLTEREAVRDAANELLTPRQQQILQMSSRLVGAGDGGRIGRARGTGQR